MPQQGRTRQSLRRRLARLRRRSQPEVLYTFAFPTSPPPVPPASDSSLEPATPALLTELRRTHPRELSEHKHRLLVERLEEPGQRCWVIRDSEGNPAGYCHMATTSTLNARINHMVTLAPHQVYFYDSYVVRKHRGKGLHTFATAKRCEIAADLGFTEGVTTITRTNAPSIAAFAKFGATRRETLVHLPLLGRTLRLPRRR